MSWQETLSLSSTLVVAVAKVVYTIGTFMLWIVGRASYSAMKSQVDLIKLQYDSQSEFNKAVTKGATLDAHREIWLPIVSNPELAQLLEVEEPDDHNRVACDFLGTILVNHCSRIFDNYRANIYDATELDAFKRDARHLFSYPLVKWRWKEVAKYHSTPFNDFIHANVIS